MSDSTIYTITDTYRHTDATVPTSAKIIVSNRHYDPMTDLTFEISCLNLTDANLSGSTFGSVVGGGSCNVTSAVGFITKNTTATANNATYFRGNVLAADPDRTILLDTVWNLPTTATRQDFIGVVNHLTYASLTEKAGFYYTSSATNLQFVITTTATSTTFTFTDFPVSTGISYHFRMEIDALGMPHAWVDGKEQSITVDQGLNTSNGLTWCWYTKTLSAAVKKSKLKYLQFIMKK